jgi:hypothetical protein
VSLAAPTGVFLIKEWAGGWARVHALLSIARAFFTTLLRRDFKRSRIFFRFQEANSYYGN